MISATRNIQYVLKKLVGLIVFEKDIFDLVRKCLGEH